MEFPGDGELLARFARAGDEAPFQELLRRHGQMVFQACVRVLGNDADAEDATQAVFLTLAQKAKDFSLQRSVSLGGWLHTVAWRIATRLQTAASVRRIHEREASAMGPSSANTSAADDLKWQKLRPVLDEALADLPEKYRLALVLCDLEGRSQEEAAALLATPKRTISDRLARARELLRKRLERRGIALSVAILASLLSAQAGAGALRETFIASTAKAARLALQGKLIVGSTISGQAAALVQQALSMLLWGMLKPVGMLIILLCLGAAIAAYMAFPHNRIEMPPLNEAVAESRPADPAPTVSADNNALSNNAVNIVVAASTPIQGIPIVHPASVQLTKGQMLYVATPEGNVLIDFTVIGTPQYGANSANYRWKFRPAAGGAELSGTGAVFEKYETVTEGRTGKEIKDVGSKLTVEAGPVHLTWSHGGSKAAWIYYPHTATHARVLDNRTYDTFGAGGHPGFEF